MKAIILDTEVTGLDVPELIEIGVAVLGDGLTVVKEYEERFKPSKPISLGAMSVHHIMDEDLIDKRPTSEFKFPSDVDYMIGHNIDFDWKVVGEPDVKRICTLAMSRELWSNADSHTLSAMMYLHDRSGARMRLKNAHSAIADVFSCLILLSEIISETGIEDWPELWEFSEAARIPKKMPFGKHKGMPVSDLPQDYKKWMLKQDDVDEYLRKALS